MLLELLTMMAALLCTAELKVTRRDKVAAERILKTKWCFVDRPTAKSAHGLLELKHWI